MFLTIAAQAFEAGDFLNIFLKFCGFWGSFPYKKTFLYKKTCTTLSMATKIGWVFKYNERPSIELHDCLITWSFEVTW